MERVQQWCKDQGWEVFAFNKEVHEQDLGSYSVPYLQIHVGPTRLHIDPVARQIINANGRVDVMSMPSLDRFTLIRHGDQWRVYDANVLELGPLDQNQFIKLVSDLAQAA